MRLLMISGSLREASHNTKLLRAAAGTLPPGVEAELLDAELLRSIPAYDEDLDAAGTPAAVRELKDRIAQADAVLVATPEYNGSIPGTLKNALDWVSRPFADNPLRGKPAAVVGTSTGLFGAVWAQAELRKVLGTIGADVLDAEFPLGQADDQFREDGRLLETSLHEALAEHVGGLALVATPAAAAA